MATVINLDIDFTESTQVYDLIETGFSGMPKRQIHVLTVADKVLETARELKSRGLFPSLDEQEAYCAALLHDVGYIDELQDTGFHPIDGAKFLEEKGHRRLAELIVGHSNSPEEAKLTGLPCIHPSNDIIAKLITYWDVQVKQGGEVVSYEERVQDVIDRYGADSEKVKAHMLAKPRIEEILEEVNNYLADYSAD